MAILAFQKPDKVLMLEASSTFGKFEFRPLEPGYGITIGNALRRILLSSLEGYAFSSVKIEGVDHEFATIPGVMEDMTNIILNLKQVRFRCLGAPLNEEDDEEEEAETEEVEAEKAPEEKEEKKRVYLNKLQEIDFLFKKSDYSYEVEYRIVANTENKNTKLEVKVENNQLLNFPFLLV